MDATAPTEAARPLAGMEAVVLAAGLGERLRPLSLDRPKCLFPVMNRPLLGVCLEWLAGLGVVRAWVNTHHLAGQVQDWLDHDWLAQARPPIDVRLSFEPEILGTGGGIRQAARGITNTFAVVNADCVLRRADLAGALALHRERGALATLCLQEAGSPRSVTLHEGRVTSLRGRPEGAPGVALGFTGVHFAEPELVARLPEGFSDIIDTYLGSLARGEAVCGWRLSGHYFRDIGTPAGYLALHHDIFSGAAAGEPPLLAGSAPGSVLLAPGVWPDVGAQVGPEVVAGPGVRFGAGSSVRRCILWEGAEIAEGVEVEGCIVGRGGRVARSASREMLVA